MKLNLKLRELREGNDMSQAEMAKLLGCSQQTYSRYESHTTEIPLDQLIFLLITMIPAWIFCLGLPIAAMLIRENNGI